MTSRATATAAAAAGAATTRARSGPGRPRSGHASGPGLLFRFSRIRPERSARAARGMSGAQRGVPHGQIALPEREAPQGACPSEETGRKKAAPIQQKRRTARTVIRSRPSPRSSLAWMGCRWNSRPQTPRPKTPTSPTRNRKTRRQPSRPDAFHGDAAFQGTVSGCGLTTMCAAVPRRGGAP